MSARNFFDDLFGIPRQPEVPKVEYPETAQDGGHKETSPNFNSKFFDPEFPKLKPVADVPGVAHPDGEWLRSTLQGKFIPYIGAEEHGMDINVDPSALPVNDIDLIAARGHAYGSPLAAPHTPPVPVTVVDTPSYFGIERRFSTNQYALPANTVTTVCSKRPERTQVTLAASTSGPIAIGQTVEQLNAGVGFLLAVGQQITLHTNQPIYALTTVANSVICALEEYTVVEGQKRF